jgi:exopolysaccharide biosynthesis polyprenyl glycosylphosphotransferase
MLRRQRQIRTRIQQLVDVGLFTLAFWIAHAARANWQFLFFWDRPEIQPFATYAWLILVILLITPPLLEVQGFYDRPLVASRWQTIWQLFRACGWATVIVILASFLAREQPARGVIVLFGAISFVLVLIKEELIRRWVQSKFGQDQLKRRLLLAGAPGDTMPLRARLKAQSHNGIEILAEVDLDHTSIEQLVEMLHEHSANGVVLSARHTVFGRVEKVIQACELEGVEVWLLADFFKTQISQTALDDFEGRPMLVFRSTPEASWQSLGKQVMDAAAASFLIVVSSPFMLAVALLIKCTSKGPVLFRQQRAGLNGKPFTMLKFRSMATDAEQHRHELEVLNEMSGPVFKVSNDPRVTKIGRIIRKFSLDEFPQLINVLRGEMSLVGPRPLPLDEVKRFDELAHRRRLSVKPGITCLWQVSGRNNVKDFRDWVRLDLEYIDNWSLWLDLKILFRTIPVVLLGTGAK